MRRILFVPLVALLMVVGVAAPAQAATLFDRWEAIDVDGSNMFLIVSSSPAYYTYSVDDSASVCPGASLAKVYGPGQYFASRRLLVVQWTVSCASGGPLLGPFTIGLRWDGADTMVDSTGVTWHRW